MATLEELVIKLSADTGQLQSELKTASAAMTKATDKMSASVGDLAKTTQESASFMQRAMATAAGFIGGQVVIGAFNMAKDAAGQLFQAFIVDGTKAAAQMQTAMNDLVQALHRSGNASASSAAEFDEFAAAIQGASRFADDAVISAAALIENLTQLDSKALKSVTQSTVDLAAALGKDLNSTATLVSKAIEGNTVGLSKFGIEVEKGATKTEQFNNVMSALSRFQGAAASQLNTAAGSMARLGNTFEDLTEVTGKAIVENKVIVAVLKTVGDVVGQITKDFAGSGQGIREAIGGAIVTIIDFGMRILSTADMAMTAAKVIIAAYGAVGTAIGTAAAAAMAAVSGNFSAIPDIIRGGAADIKESFSQAFQNPALEYAGEKLMQIQTAAKAAFEETKKGAVASVEPLGEAGNKVVALSEQLKMAQEAAKGFADQQIAASTSINEQYAMDLEALAIQNEAKLISEDQFQQARIDMLIARQAEEDLLLAEGLRLKGVQGQQAVDAELALAQRQKNELDKLRNAPTAAQQKSHDDRVAQTSQFFGNISQLSKTGNKELGAIAKAAAIAQATVDTYAGATKAFAQGGFFGFAMAASVVAAGLANIAKISATPLATGITEVPGIGGSDNFPAMLAPGERVVPSETNQDLTKFLAEGAGAKSGGGITYNITINDAFTADPRDMGMKIIEFINEARQANGVEMLGSKVG